MRKFLACVSVGMGGALAINSAGMLLGPQWDMKGALLGFAGLAWGIGQVVCYIRRAAA